ncbi:MAG: orotidine-5'-phosphate decarboxylase [Peptococcales bacterium]|jgi:orotidine-5'-phosphate decarboxylase
MQDKLIVALDKPSFKSAQELILELGNTVSFYKVGLELFLNTQGEIIRFLKNKDKRIFLDLKFHDIPNTVAQAAKWATSLGVDMFDVHASGGSEMLEKTMEMVRNTAAQNGIIPPKVIAITVLTSFNEAGFAALGSKYSIQDAVLKWAEITKESGLDGVVCSPWEAQEIKARCGKSFLTVCPGVRPQGAETQDQKRVMTPREAISTGVDHIVVGRPINQAPNPQLAAEKIIEEMTKI